MFIDKDTARALLWETTPFDQRDALYRQWFQEDELERQQAKVISLRDRIAALEKLHPSTQNEGTSSLASGGVHGHA